MADTLRKLGELLLSSIPTIIFLAIVWAAYRLIVHRKLEQVLAERRARTAGAMEQARAEIGKAEARTAEYEEQVRLAKSQIFASQEAFRRKVLEERNRGLGDARKQAEAKVKSARADMEKEVAAAKQTLEVQAGVLADQIIATVLPPAAAAGGRRD